MWRGCKVRERRGSDEAARRGGDAWERLRRSKRRRRRIRHDARVVHVPSRLSRAEGPPLARHRAVDCNAHAAVTAAMMNAARRGTCVFAPESSTSLTSTRGGTHAVSWPVGSSPAARVSRGAHATHAFDNTCSSARIRTRCRARGVIASRAVSPDAHATHGVRRPCRPSPAHPHAVSGSVGSSPAARVSAVHATQVPGRARSRRTESPRAVSEPVVIASRASLARCARARVRRHCSFVAHPHAVSGPWGHRRPRRVIRRARHASSRGHALVRGAQVAAHAVSEPVGSSPAARVSPDAHATRSTPRARSSRIRRGVRPVGSSAARSDPPVRRKFETRARSRRTVAAHGVGQWGHRQPRESRPMRTPRTRSTPRARSSRIRTRCRARGVIASPRVIRPCTPRKFPRRHALVRRRRVATRTPPCP